MLLLFVRFGAVMYDSFIGQELLRICTINVDVVCVFYNALAWINSEFVPLVLTYFHVLISTRSLLILSL